MTGTQKTDFDNWVWFSFVSNTTPEPERQVRRENKLPTECIQESTLIFQDTPLTRESVGNVNKVSRAMRLLTCKCI